ncbi:MAG: aminodeoxychorismate synthase component I [Bacteroidales bacterium]|nr:aminodeoxychorismate synthase component I [Bacteroidales bacterium]
MIVYKRFRIYNNQKFIELVLTKLKHIEQFMVLNSNSNFYQTTNYDFLIAIGLTSQFEINVDSGDVFDGLQQFYQNKPDWIFGHISYDLKNSLENLTTNHRDEIDFPKVFFFRPKILILCKKDQVEILLQENSPTQDQALADSIIAIANRHFEQNISYNTLGLNISAKITKERYVEGFRKIQDHIQKGNIYEANYCQEFFTTTNIQHPEELYVKLNKISPAPFSAFYRNQHRYLLCASPERYLTKNGDKIISQPIKGTTRRGITEEEDRQQKEKLQQSAKEKAENVMIVDLVRNDLARTAERGSVKVEELFGIYSFPQVHQMISTISSQLKEGFTIFDVLKTTFPMGSMTGAPKISAMKIIDETEAMARGLFSGTVGYISPEGNADFNVIIRSLQYNDHRKLLSFITGGAITIQSNAEDEYEECFVKANGLFKALE